MIKSEEKTFNKVMRHYDMAKEDLDTRIPDIDKADELFRSFIDEDNWPYSAMIFLPRIFTAIFEKTSRLIGGKPRGRLVPREKGDILGAKLNNALLEYEWDDATRVDGLPLVAKWAMMDMNTRKYGAAFGIARWHYEKRQDKVWFDGPNFQVLNNRDSLANPSYSSIKKWFDHREYLTLHELVNVNYASSGKPIYNNLDELRDKIKNEMKSLDTREANYLSRNKSIKGYSDYLGRDEFNKIVEIVTEYSEERWVTFAPKQGIVLRDIKNPYKHGQIPVILLKYYPIDDDLYGIPEWEPVEKPQRALNAITSQYIDAVNIELHSPIGIDSTRVRMHTIELGAGKRWIVTGDPRTAITKYDFGSPSAIGSYQTTYKILTGEIQEGLGETSQITSNLDPLRSGKTTATEIKDTAAQRLARDNFNQIFLSEALKQQMMFWYSMNQQFMFKAGETEKILRIVGKEYIDYFTKQGLDQMAMSDEGMASIMEAEAQGTQVNPDDYMQPLYPVKTKGGMIPKMELNDEQNFAEVHLTPDDTEGNYDYIADIQSMQPPNQEQLIAAKMQAIGLMSNPQIVQQMQMEGKQPKISELIEDTLEDLGFKDAGKYFTSLNEFNAQGQGQAVAGGAGVVPPSVPNSGNGQVPRMGAVPQIPRGQNQPFMAGPPPSQIQG